MGCSLGAASDGGGRLRRPLADEAAGSALDREKALERLGRDGPPRRLGRRHACEGDDAEDEDEALEHGGNSRRLVLVAGAAIRPTRQHLARRGGPRSEAFHKRLGMTRFDFTARECLRERGLRVHTARIFLKCSRLIPISEPTHNGRGRATLNEKSPTFPADAVETLAKAAQIAGNAGAFLASPFPIRAFTGF
jgi:hypothetical protein